MLLSSLTASVTLVAESVHCRAAGKNRNCSHQLVGLLLLLENRGGGIILLVICQYISFVRKSLVVTNVLDFGAGDIAGNMDQYIVIEDRRSSAEVNRFPGQILTPGWPSS
jgi:hypothetical protein